MVLGRRFKLYFILCVWNIMAAAPQPFAFNPGLPDGVAAEDIDDLVKRELSGIYQRYSIHRFQPNRIEELMQACATEAFADMLIIFYPITIEALRNNRITHERVSRIIREIAFPPQPNAMDVNSVQPTAGVPVADMRQVGPGPAGFQFAQPVQGLQRQRAFNNPAAAAALGVQLPRAAAAAGLDGPPPQLRLERHGGRRKHKTRHNKKQRKHRQHRRTRKY